MESTESPNQILTPKVLTQSQPQNPIQESYIKRLDDKEKVAYKIAANYLQTSFDLEKSLGFKKYEKKNKSN